MKVIKNEHFKSLDFNKKVYTCTNCETPFNWGENSSWFGSRKQEDNKEIKVISCSEKCRTKLAVVYKMDK